MKSIADLSNLKDRVALITGGAGHIAKAMASALIELNCSVILVDINESLLEKAKHTLHLEGFNKVETIMCDLSNAENIKTLHDHISMNYKRLDILINNAAFVGDSNISGWSTDFKNQELGTWKKALDLNLTVPFLMAQTFSELLAKNKNGSIINIGSIYGVAGPDLSLYKGTSIGNPAAYSTSKGGLCQLTRWLSTILAPDIRVNTLSPGGVLRSQPKIFVNNYSQRTPLKRMATEEDFKGAIVFLSSDMSAYVTGHNLLVDGGWTAW